MSLSFCLSIEPTISFLFFESLSFENAPGINIKASIRTLISLKNNVIFSRDFFFMTSMLFGL
ncbi:MAG: hypothetical protein VX458_03615 [Bacteroidota bacterium]|nr:hypothetical protein [Bacteroidota bacterium]